MVKEKQETESEIINETDATTELTVENQDKELISQTKTNLNSSNLINDFENGQLNKQLPEFLHPESLGVFVEGWALYAEFLGGELGLYQDPIQYFGMLSMEMHRAIRLVVDTGIHGKGWTREQAIQYSLDHEAESEAAIISEIERYMATPGQALSYKIGQLKIQELRYKATRILGDKFNIKEFHDQVLNTGSLPLVILEKKINNWINTQGV